MSIFKKTIIVAISIIVALFIVFTIVLWMYDGELFFMAPSYNKTDRFLKTNINELSYVANELSEMDYETIKISTIPIREEDRNSMRVTRESLGYETIPIPNELIEHINALYESGIQYISCGGGFVNFTMWSTMDESRGIIYSDNGTKPDGEQLIKVSTLSEDNWYYYVHNYEKAKARNPERFK